MKIYFAADHAGFDLKTSLMQFVGELGHEAEDCGAYERESTDDYPGIVASAARALADDVQQGIDNRAIVIGGSGEGEAMAANRFRGVRAALYYGPPAGGAVQTDASGEVMDIITSSRKHNNANALALAARFMTEEVAKAAVQRWLETKFSGDERHARRIVQLDTLA